ncbi:hypothetical protein AU378_11095 [Chryseobacterium kwangjuense]|uniref:FHA domain-containing protein n=2 Tax=Chryseobacterium kwangjuense TaxID=267125 RepID=A0A135WDH6_9FLAO|nr:hypothetical protein AU378_11095 [Chryseobacterium kwangjuense]
MITRCPNSSCKTKMSLNNKIIENPKANVKCPSCNEFFKPFELLTDEQKKEIEERANQPKENTDSPKNEIKFERKPVGWLVVHDEKTHSQTYDLYEGLQVVGKKSQTLQCDIMIEIEDPYLSRNHFTIEARKSGNRVHYLLKDKQSANGTFVETKVMNGFTKQLRRLRDGEEIYIEDGAIIQAGDTKIIFKSQDSVNNKAKASELVKQQEIPKTVIL